MKKALFFCIALTAVVFASFSLSFADTVFVTIGTGDITGVYYPTGWAIAKMINKKKQLYNIRATVESTDGSVFNVNAVVNGGIDFGVVQSDLQYHAVKGIEEWRDKGPQANLRAVFSIHPESVTLAAAVDSGITDVSGLKSKRVNIGNPGSGQRQNAIAALAAAGLDYEKDIKAHGVMASEAPSMLQNGLIDAFFYTVGHPSSAFKEATEGSRKVRFVAITQIDDLLKKNPYYARTSVPAAMYPGVENNQDVPTFGVKATFVTSVKTPDDIVYAVTREVFENLGSFKKMHPAFEGLTRESMLEGLSAPIHPGAMKYYREAGLMK